MRRKPWADEELHSVSYFVPEPAALRGKWREAFSNENPIHLELGCGKGRFLAQLACGNPQINYIGVDIKSAVLGLAKRNIERIYGEAGRKPDNVRILSQDIERIFLMLSPEDPVERIYINFCNPWPKPKHKKKRLTHPRQLLHYREFLVPGGEIWFKTDDASLFEESLAYFAQMGFSIQYLTRDLHQSGFSGNITTEHEEMFSSQGIPIRFLIARKEELPPGGSGQGSVEKINPQVQVAGESDPQQIGKEKEPCRP